MLNRVTKNGDLAIYKKVKSTGTVNLRHSQLNHLSPVGVGSPYVESLLGYLSRLAESHCMSISVIFSCEVAPAINKVYLLRDRGRRPANFDTVARAANGMGVIAQDWVNALELLTLRRDLKFLTMLAWRDILTDGQLIRRRRSWCPACLESWLRNGELIIEPLIWALKTVTACPRHSRRLRTKCNKCNRTLPLLSAYYKPGHCQYCGIWLGEPEENTVPEEERLTPEEHSWQGWTVKSIGELLAAAPRLPAHPTTNLLVKALSTYFPDNKTLNMWSATNGFSGRMIKCWKDGRSAPQLNSLLKFSYRTNIPLINLITAQCIPTLCLEEVSLPKKEALRRRETKRGTIDRVRLQKELQDGLIEYPPLSLSRMSSRFGCAHSTVLRIFPDLANAISQRYQAYMKDRLSRKVATAKRVLETSLTEDPPPRLEELSRRAGYKYRTELKKALPELYCKAIERYSKHSKDRYPLIRSSLQKSLDENPPPSLAELSMRTGFPEYSMRRASPDLARAVSMRYISYKKKVSTEGHESLRKEVRQIAKSLHAKGVYPSVARVAERLMKPIVLNGNAIALGELRKVRGELGLKPKGFDIGAYRRSQVRIKNTA